MNYAIDPETTIQSAPMDPEIKTRWIEALESGEYKKGVGILRTSDTFCCLGVLCELAAEEGVVEAGSRKGSYWYGNFEEQQEQGVLPKSVMSWAGIAEQEGRFGADDYDRLSSVNDGADTFEPVIEIIKEKF